MNLDVLIDPLAATVIVALAAVFPWMGVRDYRRLVRWIRDGRPDARVRHYNEIAVWEWITAIVFLAWWFASGREAAPLRLVWGPSGWQWLAVAVGFALCALLVLQWISSRNSPKTLSGLRDTLGQLEHMVPRNATEQRAFDRVSVTAGVCEEILYRGILLAILEAAFGTWFAVLGSSAVFGLAHLYQGTLGFVKTAAIGLVFALLVVFSGSLFPAILVHIVMDLTNGRLLAAAIRAPAADPASA